MNSSRISRDEEVKRHKKHKKYLGDFFPPFIFVHGRNESKGKLKGGEIEISFPEEEAGDGHFKRVEGLKVEGYHSSYRISKSFEKIGGNCD